MNQSSIRTLFLQYVAQTSEAPPLLEPDFAEGVYVTDISGKQYIDFISGIAVSALGHRHPRIVAAVEAQLNKFLHVMVYGEFAQSPQALLAAKLAENLPPVLNNVYFTNSGAEAIEGAIKLAKRATGRSEIISFENAYHGSTHGALSAMGSEYFKTAYRPLLPGFRQIPYNHCKVLNQISSDTAAVIFEPVQGESGVTVPERAYVKKLVDRCRETGTLLIADEIQCGMGRTGSLFAFEHFNFVPDILVLAKALGAGLPLGAFVAEKKLMALLSKNPVLGHISTFGGNALCCAAALAGLEVLIETRIFEQAEAKGQLIRRLLENHPAVKGIKGIGLMMSVKLKDTTTCLNAVQQCMQEGLITDWFLFADHSLRIAPPLIIADEQIAIGCERILTALNKLK